MTGLNSNINTVVENIANDGNGKGLRRLHSFQEIPHSLYQQQHQQDHQQQQDHHHYEHKKQEELLAFPSAGGDATNGSRPIGSAAAGRNSPGAAATEPVDCGDAPRTSVLMELTDRGAGVLHDVLRYFWKYDVNICRIESRPSHATTTTLSSSSSSDGSHRQQQQEPGQEQQQSFDFFVDFQGSGDDPNVRQLLTALGGLTDRLLILDAKRVHWFPRHAAELDRVANRTLDAGTDLEADHPGFSDPVYRARRGALTRLARQHAWDRPIPHVDYTPEETAVWTAVWDQMEPLQERYACREYLSALEQMKLHCGYSRNAIPQQRDISAYLHRATNFTMRPVAGLLSSRDFLNALAFRTFFSTQYVRHSSRPLYTPEPDLCHELLGHAPLFADRDFADFSQEIGLASLGAADADVTRLAHVRTYAACRCVAAFLVRCHISPLLLLLSPRRRESAIATMRSLYGTI